MPCFPRGLAHDLAGAASLSIHCNGCGWRGDIPADTALKRFGSNAAPYDVERKLCCPACGRFAMSAYIPCGDARAGAKSIDPPFRGQVGHPEGFTLNDCRRLGLRVTGVCNRCGERTLAPDPKEPRHSRWWTRRVWLLFAEGKLICGVCKAPFWGMRIDEAGSVTTGSGRTLAMWTRHDPAIRAHGQGKP